MRNELQYLLMGEAMENVKKAQNLVDVSRKKILNDLFEYLSIPSISSDPAYRQNIDQAAQWVENKLQTIGVTKTEILDTGKHPVVYGSYSEAGPEKPTMLIYGHYDVQPPDPIDLWESDPFSPTIRENLLFARGASDMKGQLMVALSAIDAVKNTSGLPINIKFLVEGEEEIGSPNIEKFLETHKTNFESDFVLNLDAGMLSENQPSIVYGLRGLAYFEIHIQGPTHDLHSGLFGGIVRNPIHVLADLISKMKDEDGVIQLPGFYSDVHLLSEKEKSILNQLGLDEEYFKKQTGSSAIFGEAGYTPIERIGARPTLDCNGIISGYTGVGPKTVIPSKAMAKLSMRLVPDQSPTKVKAQLQEFIEKNIPTGMVWEVKQLSADPAYVGDPQFYATQCFAKSLENVFGIAPIYQREGGSIPIASYLKDLLGINSILSGFGLPDDKIHSPNERLNLDVFWKGIDSVIDFIYRIAEEKA
jgi:acetylornithine deacetylase/succinyl-diaminopimelate desuccinylase-like protein